MLEICCCLSVCSSAKGILADVTESLRKDHVIGDEPFLLDFSGMGNFGNSVVFVKAKDSPAKDKLQVQASLLAVRPLQIDFLFPVHRPHPLSCTAYFNYFVLLLSHTHLFAIIWVGSTSRYNLVRLIVCSSIKTGRVN